MMRRSKYMYFLAFLCLAVLLSSCSAAPAAPKKGLNWEVNVIKAEIKPSLKTTEAVTQYDGTKVNVDHTQDPASGSVFLIIHIKAAKTGSQSDPFDWKQLNVLDKAGNAYARHANDSFLEQYGYKPRITGLPIRFGENEGWLCYEIPAAAQEQLTLAYQAEGSQQQIPLKP